MDETPEERLARLKKTLSDRQAAYNALGSSGAGWRLEAEMKQLRADIAREEQK